MVLGLGGNSSFHTRLFQVDFSNTIHKVRSSGSWGWWEISISHVRYVALPNSSHSLLLNHICHTPIISNNLISVSKLCRDNKAFVEFHPDYFLVKDQDTQYPPPGTHWLWPLQSLLTTILLMLIHLTFYLQSPHHSNQRYNIWYKFFYICNIQKPRASNFNFCNSCMFAKSHSLPIHLS